MDNSLINNTEENTVDQINEDTVEQVNDDINNKMFRGLLTVAVLASFVIFVYLLIYFCENTGA